MKPNKYIAVFSLLNALAFCSTHSSANAEPGDKGSQRGGQAKFSYEQQRIHQLKCPVVSRSRTRLGSRGGTPAKA
mgnify:CR=1 FL=1